MADEQQKERQKQSTFETQTKHQHPQDQPLLTDLSSVRGKTKCKYVLILAIVAVAVGILIFIVFYLDLFKDSSPSRNECKYDRKLIIISLDGFRSEYFENPNISTPNLDYIKETGVYIKQLIPAYPTITFPDHYSIVTGLYPGDHGIVSNWFWDPILKQQFSMGTKDVDGRWYKGEPIWMTHRMPQNIDEFGDIFNSATIFWVGSDQNVSGKGYPDYYMDYNGSYPYTKRIDNIVDLLQSNQYRVILGYFEEPDSTGHDFGPNSDEIKVTVNEMDTLVGYLMDSIRNVSVDLFENTDIVITSDHGMSETSMNRLIFVNSTQSFNLWNDTQNFRLEERSAYLFIKITENSTFTSDQVMQLLTTVIYPLEDVGIYNKDTIPYEYSESYNSRIPDVMVVAPTGYQFYFNGVNETQQSWLNTIGKHGYNNSDFDMSALFVARGPSFKVNYTKEMVESINLYSMFCKIMCGMEPSPNNGSLDQIEDILHL